MRTLAFASLLLAAATLAFPLADAECGSAFMDLDGDGACWRYDEPMEYVEAVCGADQAGELDGCPGGIHNDGDQFPDFLEPFLCVVESGETPGDGACEDGDYRVPE